MPVSEYVQRRDRCEGEARKRCFGVATDGWDTWRIDSKRQDVGLVAQPFEYATLEYRSDRRGPAARWDRRQTDAVVARLDELAAQDKPVALVVLVHGWHHNAWEDIDPDSPDNIRGNGDRPYNQDLNLLAFKHILAKTKYELGRQGEGRRTVLGVYVGWNGGPPDSVMNFARIGTAADRIGNSADFAEDIGRIVEAATRKPSLRNPVLAIGHSFGGRLLSRFMLRSTAMERRLAQPFGSRSLVVTINPAIGADAFDDLVGKGYSGTAARPYWINVTSSDDKVTGRVFPLGASLGRAVGIGAGFTDKIFARSAYSTIGHFADYRTHILKMPYFHAEAKCSAQSCIEYDGCRIPARQNGLDASGYFGPLTSHPPRKTNWFLSENGEKTPLFYDNANCDAKFHFIDLERLSTRYSRTPASRWMWNVYTDRQGIDVGHDDARKAGKKSPSRTQGDDCTSDGSDLKATSGSREEIRRIERRRKICKAAVGYADHNAFVQTRFVRMFLELVLDKP